MNMDKIRDFLHRVGEIWDAFYIGCFGPIVLGTILCMIYWLATHPR